MSADVPDAPGATDAPGANGTTADPDRRTADRWRVAGLAVLGTWAVLLGLAVALWVRVAALPGPDEDVHGYLRLFGAPFALLAVGILWWVWRSARHLLHRRPEGWTLPLALGGVALAQCVVTALPLALAGGSGAGDVVLPFAAGAALGAVSLVVALLGRRSWARAAARATTEQAERMPDSAPAPTVTPSEPGRGAGSVSDPD